MDNLPRDPYMLLSFVNMKLRDFHDSLDNLCDDLGVSREDIEKTLNDAGFSYDPSTNRFS